MSFSDEIRRRINDGKAQSSMFWHKVVANSRDCSRIAHFSTDTRAGKNGKIRAYTA